jgi:hypothetical protein
MVDIPSDWKILGVLLSSIEDPKIVENIDLRQTEVNLGDKVFGLSPRDFRPDSMIGCEPRMGKLLEFG